PLELYFVVKIHLQLTILFLEVLQSYLQFVEELSKWQRHSLLQPASSSDIPSG
ncbi:hypothetical protein LINGRAHAP2_LOCUS35033, partial [Linum grandiflorum]